MVARDRFAYFRRLFPAAVALLAAITADAQVPVGDCDGNGTVEMREVIHAVEMALGRDRSAGCPGLDVDSDGRTGIAEVLRAVSSAQPKSIPAITGRYQGSGETVNECNDPSYDSTNPIATVVVSIAEQDGALFRGEISEPGLGGLIVLEGSVGANGGLSGVFAFREAPPQPLRAAHHLFTYEGTFSGRVRDGSIAIALDGTYTAPTLVCRTRLTARLLAERR